MITTNWTAVRCNLENLCKILGQMELAYSQRKPVGGRLGLGITELLLLLRRVSRVRLCETPETAAYQAPSSLGFSRQEHWSGLPFPSPMHESEK